MRPRPSAEARSFSVGRRRFTVFGLGANDLYFRQIGGRFESKFQALCARALRPGDVAIDVGANIGVTSLIMSAFVGDHGRVVAIEPGPRIFELLGKNVEANRARCVTPLRCAVSASAGQMGFQENSAYGHLIAEGAALATVEVRTLDGIVNDLGLDRLDFVKIDTEGFEPQVLAGAGDVLQRLRPMVYLELNAWTLLAYGRSDPLTFLRDLVRIYPHVLRVQRWGRTLRLERMVGEPDDLALILLRDNVCYSDGFNDLLLIPDDAALARFEGIVSPPEPPHGRGLRRLIHALGLRLRRA
jgi:FkbM family methyltransferase